ncbi:MAG: hypothetical protein ACLGH4_00810 [Actinomycetes bacterium]
MAQSLSRSATSSSFYYLTAASRDYGFTLGHSRASSAIELTELGRQVVSPQSDGDYSAALLEAFKHVDIMVKVVEYYKGNNLPEQPYLSNTLEQEFGLDRSVHDEFIGIFQANCRFVGIGHDLHGLTGSGSGRGEGPAGRDSGKTVTVASPESDDAPTCFVIMPFKEKTDRYETGFFEEAMLNLFTPAGTAAGFKMVTAQRQGSDVIHSTIINALLEADLVLADLTEHNPNVLFELGVRVAEDKPVALVRARGTGPIFDIDNLLRVQEYNPNLWPSTVQQDIPGIRDHITATWEQRESPETFMKILRRQVLAPTGVA